MLFDTRLLNNSSSMFDRIDADAHLRAVIGEQFEKQVYKGQGILGRVIRRGKACAMRSLQDLKQQFSEPTYLGLQVVDVRKIVGSENRVTDFDADFTPRAMHLQNRWVSVAIAYIRDIALPPVELIQVGDEYYVRDGHHRISVARAMDQAMIHATVTRWG